MKKINRNVYEFDIKTALMVVLTLIFIMYLSTLIGCSTVKKAKAESSIKVDSLSISNSVFNRAATTDSAGAIHHRDSSATLNEREWEEETTVWEFFPWTLDTSTGKALTPPAGSPISPRTGPIRTAGSPISRITVTKSKGKDRQQTSSGAETITTADLKKRDTTRKEEQNNLQVRREEKQKSKQVETKGPNLLERAGLALVAVLIVALALWLIVRKFKKSVII